MSSPPVIILHCYGCRRPTNHVRYRGSANLYVCSGPCRSAVREVGDPSEYTADAILAAARHDNRVTMRPHHALQSRPSEETA